jgi:CRISPR/Cas system-associated endonuclease/helicase Cas3
MTSFDALKMMSCKVAFSSATTPKMFQDSIEANIEKRQGKTFAPPNMKSVGPQ